VRSCLGEPNTSAGGPDSTTTPPSMKTPTYRSFARRLHNRYRTATPDTAFRHFIAAPGDLHHARRRRGPPAPGRPHALLLDAGYHDRRPWCDGRRLSYSFERA
jgi:hypothetical protein